MSELDDTSAELRRIAAAPPDVARLGDPRPAAVLFVLFAATGVIALVPQLTAITEPDRLHAAIAAGAGPAWRQLVGGLALAVAGVAFAIVVGRLTRIAQSIAGGDYGAVARVAANVFAALAGTAGGAFTTVAAIGVLGAGFAAVPREAVLLSQLGYVLLTVPGMVAAAVAVFGTAFAVWRAGRQSTAVAIVGFAVSVFLLGGMFVVPAALLPLWALLAAFTVRRNP